MGYTVNPKTSVIECFGTAQQSITIDSAIGDITLNTIDVPAFQGNLTSAYMVCKINLTHNTNAANNSLGPLAQEIQLRDTSLVYRDAITFSNGDLFTLANSVRGFSLFWGTHDLSSYLSSGTTYSVKWNDADANLNSLVLYGLQCKLVLYVD